MKRRKTEGETERFEGFKRGEKGKGRELNVNFPFSSRKAGKVKKMQGKERNQRKGKGSYVKEKKVKGKREKKEMKEKR